MKIWISGLNISLMKLPIFITHPNLVFIYQML